MQGVLLQPSAEQCPYLEELIAIHENLLIKELENDDVDTLLRSGFRHFGEFFFRPICAHCRSCVSLRIPVQQYSLTPSVKRLFKRNEGFTVQLESPVLAPEMFALYRQHKKRFKEINTHPESYEIFGKSFFHPYPFSYILTIRDGEKLVAVSHLDITDNAMSAIYCYYDETYARYSPGKYAVYQEIQIAKSWGIRWLYLGFYIEKNRHTKYKMLFRPNQVMVEENVWIDYMDAQGNIQNPLPKPGFHLLADYNIPTH